jgi:hypothetical protein
MVSNKVEMAGLLKDFYSTIFSPDVGRVEPDFPPLIEVMTLQPIEVNTVHAQILALNLHKGPGPDEIHPAILYHLSEIITLPLTRLFNLSLQTGIVPLDWKTAVICPIFKKGNKELVENYRPICLTSIICKIMERILKDLVCQHLHTSRILSGTQHGFVSRRSCLTNLLIAEEKITKYLEEGVTVDVVFLDFAKAFDSVNHRMLLKKLASYGIHPLIVSWIRGFLNERTFRVQVAGQKSGVADAPSGVPQGSILGPMLFLLYINDLPSFLAGEVLLFADDVKIISPRNNWDRLQDSILAATNWSNDWDMRINPEKSSLLCIGNEPPLPLRVSSNPEISSIPVCSSTKDLGIMLDSSFTPSAQCFSAANKARRSLFLIRRSFENITPKLFLPLFSAMVRPHLEYAVQAWSPYLQKDIQLLEGVQRLATRMINGFSLMDYASRLRRLNLFSLERRRLRGDLITVFKVFNGEISLDPNDFFVPAIFPSTRGHQLKLFKPYVSTRRRAMCFSQRIVRNWNSLPPSILTAPNSNIFKTMLDKCWSDIFPNIA